MRSVPLGELNVGVEQEIGSLLWLSWGGGLDLLGY